jgi:predicted TIM-barrel fold metal-dependent hydrolase
MLSCSTFSVPPFQLALDVVGIERLLYSVDYPYSANTLGKGFLESLSLSADDFEKLTHGNAERLLKIGAATP